MGVGFTTNDDNVCPSVRLHVCLSLRNVEACTETIEPIENA